MKLSRRHLAAAGALALSAPTLIRSAHAQSSDMTVKNAVEELRMAWLKQDKAKLESYTKENKMPWPQFFDGQFWNNKLSAKYGVRSIPATYLLDGEGTIIGKGEDIRGENLDGAVAKALARK